MKLIFTGDINFRGIDGLDIEKCREIVSEVKPYFEKCFVSEAIGVPKPHKEFFDYVEENIEGFDKTKTLVIGDSLTSDIQGGINAGIDTCWFNPKGEKTDLDITYEIKSLKELYDIV